MPTCGCLSMLHPFSKSWASSKEAARPIFIVFGLTRPGFEPLTCPTQSGCSNHYAIESEHEEQNGWPSKWEQNMLLLRSKWCECMACCTTGDTWLSARFRWGKTLKDSIFRERRGEGLAKWKSFRHEVDLDVDWNYVNQMRSCTQVTPLPAGHSSGSWVSTNTWIITWDF